MAKPSIALSKNASSASITSAMKMLADLPPSSKVTGIRLSAAAFMITLPVAVEPVKAILAMRFEEASAWPASRPYPLTMFSTPGGRMSPMMSISTMMPIGVCSAGLSTMQLPAAKAGAIFQAAIRIGKFQGMIWPTTPSGSWK